MPQSAYSWMGSRVHLVLDDEVADSYNRAQRAFFEAQKHHMDIHGEPWNPTLPLMIHWTPQEEAAFNNMGKVINAMIELNGDGLDIPEDEITSDFLMKL